MTTAHKIGCNCFACTAKRGFALPLIPTGVTSTSSGTSLIPNGINLPSTTIGYVKMTANVLDPIDILDGIKININGHHTEGDCVHVYEDKDGNF